MTLKNNRASLLRNIKLYASFHHHMWIQTGVTVRKRLSWVVTSVTLTFDLWPWPFAWTLLWSLVITPETFMMIRWWEHSQKGVTDGQTDRRTDRQTENTICRAAWSQLKNIFSSQILYTVNATSCFIIKEIIWACMITQLDGTISLKPHAPVWFMTNMHVWRSFCEILTTLVIWIRFPRGDDT